jgi:hypothetical protein
MLTASETADDDVRPRLEPGADEHDLGPEAREDRDARERERREEEERREQRVRVGSCRRVVEVGGALLGLDAPAIRKRLVFTMMWWMM